MSLRMWLEHPDLGIVAPPVVAGEVTYDLDYYPRMALRAQLRPSETGIPLWSTPYGTRCFVGAADGALVFSGDVIRSSVSRPDGGWTIEASDDINRLRDIQHSGSLMQRVPGGPMDMSAFIRALAAYEGVQLTVPPVALGSVDPRTLDLADTNAWAVVEEQLDANALDVLVGGDGSLTVRPVPTIKAAHDVVLQVGEAGTIVRYDLAMSRRYNRVMVTHVATKEGAAEPHYIGGLWEDRTTIAGIQSVGPRSYARTVRVGADWYDDMGGHLAQASANAAALAAQVAGYARTMTLAAVPDYSVRPGMTARVTLLNDRSDLFLVTAVQWPLGAAGDMMVALRSPDPSWGPARMIDTPERGRRSHAWHNSE